MKKLLLLCGLLAITSVSCIKREFDLNQDLDLTIRVGGDVIFIPIGTTDSLFLRDFLDADEIAMLDTINGDFVIIVEDSLSIEVPEINEFDGVSIIINEDANIDFGNFPVDVDFNVDPLTTEVESDTGFYLPQPIVDIIRNTVLPMFDDGTIDLQQLNAFAQLSPILSATGLFPLPLSASMDTIIEISISKPLDNDYIISVDTLRLQANSGFDVFVKPKHPPHGIGARLDSLFLVFPSSVRLDASMSNPPNKIITNHTFMIRNFDLDVIEGNDFVVPILYLTNIFRDGYITLTDSIEFFARYSLTGSYSGGFFPTRADSSTHLDLTVTPNLTFASATVTLDNNRIDAGLERTAFKFEISEIIPNDITVNRIDNVVFENTQLALNLTLTEDHGTIINNLEVDVRIEFPQDIVFAPHPNIIGNVFENNLRFVSGIPVPLNFEILGLTPSADFISHNIINFNDSIVVEASVRLINPQINTKSVENIALDLSVTGGMDINFSRIHANIEFEIPPDRTSVDLSELPDILMNNRDSLILDVNPYLSLSLNTNLQIPFDATVFLYAYRGSNVINTLNIPINIEATTGVETKTRFWIADENTPPPTTDYEHIKRDLGAIIRTVFPDSIVIRIDGGINNDAIFDFNINYFAEVDYQFVVPLAFGEDFRIVIQDTFELDSIIGEMISGNRIGLAVRALNNIPLDLRATVIAIDENNNPLTNVEISEFVIKAGMTMDSVPATLDIDDKNSDQLQYMRGLIFQFEAKTGSGRARQPLRPDNFIQVRLNARIDGGMIIDLNDL